MACGRRTHVPVIGLAGGVGSGKSELARRLSERRNVQVIDGDEAGHQALKRANVKSQIRQRFGESVFDPSGQINRGALAGLVFGADGQSQAARADLESIVHPEIEKSLEKQIEQIRASNGAEAIILDAAVLIEAGWRHLCDTLVFVDTPGDVRRERVLASRGWTARQFQDRESSQLPVKQKRSRADFVVPNGGSLDTASVRLEQVLDNIRQRTARAAT